jgi:predicted transcriptional regulator
MEQLSLMEMTTEIVAAHVANNTVAVKDVALLVRSVHEALASVGGAGEAPEEKKVPAVSVRASVKPDFITCLLCGRKQKTMKRHLEVAHDMSPEQYRAEFDLPKSYPMVAPEYSQRRGDMARRIGLGRKPEDVQGEAPARSAAARQPRGAARTATARARKLEDA